MMLRVFGEALVLALAMAMIYCVFIVLSAFDDNLWASWVI